MSLIEADFATSFGTAATLAGNALTAIVDQATDSFDPDLLADSPSARVQASAAPAAAAGQAFVANATTYTVRQVIKLPPDGSWLRLILAKN